MIKKKKMENFKKIKKIFKIKITGICNGYYGRTFKFLFGCC